MLPDLGSRERRPHPAEQWPKTKRVCDGYRQTPEHKQRCGQREQREAHASNGGLDHLALQGRQTTLISPDTSQHLIGLGNDPLDLLGSCDGALSPQLRHLTLEPSEGLLNLPDGRLDGAGQSSIEDLHRVLLELGGVAHHATKLLHGLRELS